MVITHVTPHLGGGMGTVILKYIEKDSHNNTHHVFSLDRNNNKDCMQLDGTRGITIYNYAYENIEAILNSIRASDITIIHWFNHPLLFDFMVNRELPPCKLAIWNHVSGLYPPYVHSNYLVSYPDFFVFTSPVSFECEEIKLLPTSVKHKLKVIWSTCGVEEYKEVPRIKNDHFTVGFTGTVDYGKLHPDYVEMCSLVNIPDIRFTVCSGDSQEHLKKKAEELGISGRFSFMGRVPKVLPYLASYDIFGYPLQPRNFATCEQAIGEAMMCGAVPVVLDNPAEKYIIDNGINGIIARNKYEYADAIKMLYRNPDLLKKMSEAAKLKAEKLYDADNTVLQWQNLFDSMIRMPKKIRVWNCGEYITASGLYIISLGRYGKLFLEYIFYDRIGDECNKSIVARDIKKLFDSNLMFSSPGKGSVLQYLKFFPYDKYLREWRDILNK